MGSRTYNTPTLLVTAPSSLEVQTWPLAMEPGAEPWDEQGLPGFKAPGLLWTGSLRWTASGPGPQVF